MTHALAETKFSPETKSVPKQAMQFECGAMRLAASKAGDGFTEAPINMLGRSAEPIDHWYWGTIVHDMAGFSADQERVPIDWRHDDEEALGYIEKFRADKRGLRLSGKLISFKPDDRADRLMKESDAGIPYQASIFFRTERLEYVPDGFTTEVNGYQLSGPAIIVREWGLRGMAVCLYGADHRTQSKFTDGDNVPVEIFSSESIMAKTKTEPTQNQLTETSGTSTVPPTTSPVQLTEAPVVDPRTQFAETLKRFVEKFGSENGSKWAAEGLSYEAALDRHCEALNQQLSAKNGDIDALNKKLSSIDRGEPKAPEFGDGDAPAKRTGLASKIKIANKS